MPDFTITPIDDMEAVVFGSFKRARAVLGVESFGMQVIDLPPNAEQYPEHDHADSGQEEVFVVLRGSGEIEIDGERHRARPRHDGPRRARSPGARSGRAPTACACSRWAAARERPTRRPR